MYTFIRKSPRLLGILLLIPTLAHSNYETLTHFSVSHIGDKGKESLEELIKPVNVARLIQKYANEKSDYKTDVESFTNENNRPGIQIDFKKLSAPDSNDKTQDEPHTSSYWNITNQAFTGVKGYFSNLKSLVNESLSSYFSSGTAIGYPSHRRTSCEKNGVRIDLDLQDSSYNVLAIAHAIALDICYYQTEIEPDIYDFKMQIHVMLDPGPLFSKEISPAMYQRITVETQLLSNVFYELFYSIRRDLIKRK